MQFRMGPSIRHNGAMEDLVVTPALTIPAAELDMAFARAGGPGGQHVNKTDTKVELRWNPAASAVLSEADKRWLATRLGSRLTASGDLVVASATHRSQHRNREEARARLADLVRGALARPKRRKKTRPSRGAIERRIEGKKKRGQRKRDRTWRPD